METLRDKVVVITGAASGIGRALAVNMTKRGCLLALCDKYKSGLEETSAMLGLHDHKPFISIFDVSDKLSMQQFAEEVNNHFGRVDILINNAGVALGIKKFAEITEEEWEWILDINLWGAIFGVQSFLPHLVGQEESCIVNISSMLGLAGMIHQSAYSTTKFALRGLSESLNMELMRDGVHVMTVYPGAVKTNIVDNAWADEKSKSIVRSYMEKIGYVTSEYAADQIIRGIREKKSRVIVGKDGRQTDILTRLMPNRSPGSFFPG